MPGFGNSQAGQILRSMLRRWGFHVTDMVLDARDYGGVQGRTRYYCVASLFPGFEPPQSQSWENVSIWPIVERHLSECRDITNTSAIQNRANARGVAALITPESTHCPTFLKSQDRGVKDAVYIHDGDRYYAPSEGLIQELMSIPSDFDSQWIAKEQSIETLGQSIDYALHHRVMGAVKDHLQANLGPGPVLRHFA